MPNLPGRRVSAHDVLVAKWLAVGSRISREYQQMILGVYAPLGVFLLIASQALPNAAEFAIFSRSGAVLTGNNLI